jgi:hypothetical protein
MMGSDCMKPKYTLGLCYIAIFMLVEDWIHSSKAPVDIQGLVWFTDNFGAEEVMKVRICGLRTTLIFSLGKEICKIRLWKWASLSIDSCAGKTWRVVRSLGTAKET